MTARCTVCDGLALRPLLELGLQPPSNRFLLPEDSGTEERYALSLGTCDDCGTVQLVDRMPVEAIRPRFEWLANNEPEGHLDDLVGKLAGLAGIGGETPIVGVSYKDRSTLARFARKGFANVREIARADLAIDERPFGPETIQRRLSDPETIAGVRRAHGAAGLVLARHIIEHAESAARFLAGLHGLLEDGGYAVLEFPDNARILRGKGHAFIWEEHFTYFTAGSFLAFAARAGAQVVRLDRYPYPHEDAVVAVLRFGASAPAPVPAPVPGADVLQFARSFAGERARWQAELARLAASGRRIAVFGAGHLAVKLVNFMQLAPWIDCVVDDHPAKGGLRMPGSRLPIVPSAAMAARGIDTCISTLNPESEARARPKLADFFARGGVFMPAFETPQAA
ncbi:MAG TPA: class I SAM-dependent methyltransferase [Usitatibacter sp.]|nr:class I SAM-dependent methyltransferase [Usitatibacter sp.]